MQMRTSGLVITLDESAQSAERTLASLRREPRLALGDRRGLLLPAALASAAADEAEDFVRALEHRPGIARVDVVFVELSGAHGAMECEQEAGPWR